MAKSFNFIDLFSGCGGFSTGLEMAGHQCLLGVDFNSDAIASFAHNHLHAKTFLGDIKTLKSSHILDMVNGKKIHMVVGGPPCQGFSTVGKGQVTDDRNKLFLEFVRVVRDIKPQIIILENVTGLLAKKNNKILSAIFSEFQKLGFNMQAQVLSSEHYGVPSRRRRTFILGVRGGYCDFPQALFGVGGQNSFITVGEALANLKALDGITYNHDIVKAMIKNPLDVKRLSYIPEGAGIRYEKDQKAYLPKKYWFDVDFTQLRESRFRQTRLQRLSRDGVGPTILTSRSMYYHPIENRYLTCREAAACQSFPNEFEFIGSETSIFRQIGNAVPPMLAMALGESIKQIKPGNLKTKMDLSHHLKNIGRAFHYKEGQV
jgi:DNA (cytosine-5)-methyltransferase 1